ncbi:polyprenyl synthetase family protein [Streptomyces xanthochromogenes]|uniref:polyprenyl synthetase family protein n=1 Tax=Streptomyces xanthochromogenes TaxID=67384 RepID=UPI003829E3EB
MTQALVAQPLELDVVRRHIADTLDAFLTHKAHNAAVQRLPGEVTQVLHDFLFAGGKRLRPLLCVTGWHAAGGQGSMKPVLQVAASLEMFHAFALIHDDIMDNSPTRRGKPTVHRVLAARHSKSRSSEAADQLGDGAAILIGDLALAWADELLHSAGLTARQLTAVLPLIDAMRTEVMYGQYLDLTATGCPTDDLGRSLDIAHYKTAKYTVERPLQIGAALTNAEPEFLTMLSEFAVPIGEAFQLRDDILGVFGDPQETGKSRLDDLRDGKHTALVACALRNATPEQRSLLSGLIGNPDLTETDADRIRHLLIDTDAAAQVEQIIRAKYKQAQRALLSAALPPATTSVLQEIARTTVARTS